MRHKYKGRSAYFGRILRNNIRFNPVWHVTQETYETSLLSEVSHTAQSCMIRHSGNARSMFLEWRVTQDCAMCDTTLWRSVVHQCVTRHSRKFFFFFSCISWVMRHTIICRVLHLIRPTICLKHSFIVHKGHSTHHLVGQEGQWWGVSPGGRLGASQMSNWWGVSLRGVWSEQHGTWGRVMECLAWPQSGPTVQICCANAWKGISPKWSQIVPNECWCVVFKHILHCMWQLCSIHCVETSQGST